MQQRAGDHDRAAAEHVGEPAGGQLERHDHHAVHGEQQADLGEGEPAGLGEQHGDRRGEPDRQPAQRGEADQPPGGRADGRRRAHERPLLQRHDVGEDEDELGALGRLVAGVLGHPAVEDGVELVGQRARLVGPQPHARGR